MKTHNPKTTKVTRKRLRNNLTQPEIMLWQHLKSKQVDGYKFPRQHGILNYVVDFYCPEKLLAIEIDGDSHYHSRSIKFDKKRQQEIEALGINVVRYTNKQITTNINGVIDDIRDQLHH